jgi:CheY-like chemotaxis protein
MTLQTDWFGDKFIHSGTKQMPCKMGHRITLATNGPEPLEKWRQGDFDLIFIDVQMPAMNGPQAITQIRRRVTIGAYVPIWASALDRRRIDPSGSEELIGLMS